MWSSLLGLVASLLRALCSALCGHVQWDFASLLAHLLSPERSLLRNAILISYAEKLQDFADQPYNLGEELLKLIPNTL